MHLEAFRASLEKELMGFKDTFDTLNQYMEFMEKTPDRMEGLLMSNQEEFVLEYRRNIKRLDDMEKIFDKSFKDTGDKCDALLQKFNREKASEISTEDMTEAYNESQMKMYMLSYQIRKRIENQKDDFIDIEPDIASVEEAKRSLDGFKLSAEKIRDDMRGYKSLLKSSIRRIFNLFVHGSLKDRKMQEVNDFLDNIDHAKKHMLFDGSIGRTIKTLREEGKKLGVNVDKKEEKKSEAGVKPEPIGETPKTSEPTDETAGAPKTPTPM